MISDLSSIASLRQTFRDHRISNIDGEYLIPAAVVKQQLPEQAIEDILQCCGVGDDNSNPKWHRSHIAKAVASEARSTFAVLIEFDLCSLIPAFLKKSHRLPVTKGFLADIAVPHEAADCFFHEQHRYLKTTIPFGSVLPREVDDSRIMAFIPPERKMLSAEDAFGQVTEFRVQGCDDTVRISSSLRSLLQKVCNVNNLEDSSSESNSTLRVAHPTRTTYRSSEIS